MKLTDPLAAHFLDCANKLDGVASHMRLAAKAVDALNAAEFSRQVVALFPDLAFVWGAMIKAMERLEEYRR